MSQLNRRQFSSLAATLSVALVCGAGCHALDTSARPGMTDAALPLAGGAGEAQPASATSAAQCSVELRAHNRSPKRVMVPLDRELHVQDVLEKTGALKQFRRAEVALYRRTPTGKSHKMTIGFDGRHHRVEPQNDYAIFPGDVVVVTEDTSTMMDDLLKRVGGNIPMFGAGRDTKG